MRKLIGIMTLSLGLIYATVSDASAHEETWWCGDRNTTTSRLVDQHNLQVLGVSCANSPNQYRTTQFQLPFRYQTKWSSVFMYHDPFDGVNGLIVLENGKLEVTQRGWFEDIAGPERCKGRVTMTFDPSIIKPIGVTWYFDQSEPGYQCSRIGQTFISRLKSIGSYNSR